MKITFAVLILLNISSFIRQIKCQGNQIINSGCLVENCVSCSALNLYVCQKCQEGYSGNDCKTIDCSHVRHCSTGCYLPNKCGQCQVGYAGTGCWPIDCSEVLHCSYGCTSPNICGRCDSGFSGNICDIADCSKVSNCNAGCIQPNICKTCDIGYTGKFCLTPVVTPSNGKQDYLVSQSSSNSNSDLGFTSSQSDSKTTGLTVGLIIVSILLLISLAGLVYSYRRLRLKGEEQQLKSLKKEEKIPPSSTGMINANECIQ